MRLDRLVGSLAFGFVAVAASSAHVACSSSNSSSGNDGGTTPPATDGGGTDGGGTDGGDGGNVDLPKPVLCPETNPFSPKLPNSVQVQGVTMTADDHWTADKIYLIGDDFKVEGHKLTVDPGTTICLYQNGKIYVGEGVDPGEIHLDGTPDKPIVITTTPSDQDPTKPSVFHKGIKLDTYQGSTISNVNIWYGGPGGGGASWAFELTDTAHGTPDATKPLLVDHVTVGAVQSKGVRIGTGLGLADNSKIRFTGFVADAGQNGNPAVDATAAVAITAAASFVKAFDATGATIPAAAKHVTLLPYAADGKLMVNADLTDPGMPYQYSDTILGIQGAQNDTNGATLTIHEGVTLQLGGVIIVGGQSGTAYGNLIVSGTAAKPVVFTSIADTPAKGDWTGFYFVNQFFDPAKTKIDNAQILYAGVSDADPANLSYHVSRCGSFAVGAVMITGNPLASYAGPPITNTKIAHSASNGIVSDSSNTNGKLSTDYNKPDITFEDIAKANLVTAACP